jgi:hypothetical protein
LRNLNILECGVQEGRNERLEGDKGEGEKKVERSDSVMLK